jgi:signal transduction histidine kinase
LFQWIQTKRWLPDLAIGLFFAVALGITDFSLQGNNGLIPSLLISFAFFFFREYAFLSGPLVLAGTVVSILLGDRPTVAGFSVSLLVFLSSTLGPRLWSLVNLAVAIAFGVVAAWNAAFNSSLLTQFYGIDIYNNDGRWWGFGFAAVSIIGLNGFAWLLGGFIIEYYRERTLRDERNIVQSHNLRTMLEIAEQNERFMIASDLNEAVLERVSAMLTLTDGARYAAKLDAEVAPRTLDRLVGMIRETHDELRRLFDMLNRSVQVAAAPPNINDLNLLAVQLRLEGYPTKIVNQGRKLSLIPSAELSIYRIVFDAVENVRQHTPAGTAIDIDLIWSANGLQVLVKDNGEELARRENLELQLDGEDSAKDDLKALTEEVTGPGITGMRERAGLFNGNVEAHRVPGVGFTVNAIFPGIDDFADASER